MPPRTFQPLPADPAGILTWVHIGDLHMTHPGEQNDLDLQAIVRKVNQLFATSTSFVFLPGDVADHGDRAAYAIVRRSLDQLQLPWCAILGDHDVHEKSFANFLEAMSHQPPSTHYAFTVGSVRFLALNAFDIPEPPSFTVSDNQLRWAEDELKQATAAGQTKVLLLHCYPTDLKHGGEALVRLIRAYNVRLVDMGHTHYNEIANDGRTLYTATRSTGQIEEGPVGFSVTNLDGDATSWRFLELTEPAAVIITSPADHRLTLDSAPALPSSLTVRAKIWSEHPITQVQATLGTTTLQLTQIPNTQVWQGTLNTAELPIGTHPLQVTAHTAEGNTAEDKIEITLGAPAIPHRHQRDQDNEIGAWPEHGLLGTQLGPNKNGKKW